MLDLSRTSDRSPAEPPGTTVGFLSSRKDQAEKQIDISRGPAICSGAPALEKGGLKNPIQKRGTSSYVGETHEKEISRRRLLAAVACQFVQSQLMIITQPYNRLH